MELLLKSGASALLCDARGRSPLHAASQAGARQAVAALLRLLPPPRRDQLLLLPDLSGATAADLVRCFCCFVVVAAYSISLVLCRPQRGARLIL